MGDDRIGNPALGDTLQNLLEGDGGVGFFENFIPKFIGIGFVIAVVVFLFMFIAGAIAWIASGGDKSSIETARSKVANALVGLIILLFLFAIIKAIEAIFQIDIMTIDLSPLFLDQGSPFVIL